MSKNTLRDTLIHLVFILHLKNPVFLIIISQQKRKARESTAANQEAILLLPGPQAEADHFLEVF